jgi:LysR family glycine cleavage system transcriptional activator
LNALLSFESAARNLSFYQAAEELHVTPSAISHQIKSLESFLGVQLFERKKRQIEITPAGKRYSKFIQKALKEIDKGTQDLIASHDTGELSISMTPAFLNYWLLPRIGRFYEKNPDIQLDINASVTLIDFPRSDIDIAVYFGHGDWPNVECSFLRHSERVPVCSPKLLEKYSIKTPKDLLEHKLFFVKQRKEEWEAWFGLADTEYDMRKYPISFSSSSLAVKAAAEGVGIALADISLASESIRKGELVMPFDKRLKLEKAFYLVYQKNRKMTFAMKAFKEWMLAEMSNDSLAD